MLIYGFGVLPLFVETDYNSSCLKRCFKKTDYNPSLQPYMLLNAQIECK
jgi:hypothetical protein